MKWSDYLKIMINPGFKKQQEHHYQLVINQNLVSDLKIIAHLLHFDTYNLLKKLKTPQYNTVFLMRNKQGFTTIFFQQNFDIVICDRYGNVLKTFINQASGYISEHFPKSYFIYFMTLGSIKYHNININDRLTLKRNLGRFKLFEDVMGLK